ncbi:hypothetical protein TcBrA4_0112970 [Trypanosoma cruzi]|nr:hypothetical protein TcBrA4_0112970 [Trypanosoma cruzi]
MEFSSGWKYRSAGSHVNGSIWCPSDPFVRRLLPLRGQRVDSRRLASSLVKAWIPGVGVVYARPLLLGNDQSLLGPQRSGCPDTMGRSTWASKFVTRHARRFEMRFATLGSFKGLAMFPEIKLKPAMGAATFDVASDGPFLSRKAGRALIVPC